MHAHCVQTEDGLTEREIVPAEIDVLLRQGMERQNRRTIETGYGKTLVRFEFTVGPGESRSALAPVAD